MRFVTLCRKGKDWLIAVYWNRLLEDLADDGACAEQHRTDRQFQYPIDEPHDVVGIGRSEFGDTYVREAKHAQCGDPRSETPGS